MEIQRGGSRPSAKGPADGFAGTVRIDPLGGKAVDWMEEVSDVEYEER